jgi:hypothetical protein
MPATLAREISQQCMQGRQKQYRELLQAASAAAKTTETPRTITAEVSLLKRRNASNSRDVINSTSNSRDDSNVRYPATVDAGNSTRRQGFLQGRQQEQRLNPKRKYRCLKADFSDEKVRYLFSVHTFYEDSASPQNSFKIKPSGRSSTAGTSGRERYHKLRISARIFEKIRNGPNVILWCWGGD